MHTGGALPLLVPQSRCGDELLRIGVVCPQNGTAVLKKDYLACSRVDLCTCSIVSYREYMPGRVDAEAGRWGGGVGAGGGYPAVSSLSARLVLFVCLAWPRVLPISSGVSSHASLRVSPPLLASHDFSRVSRLVSRDVSHPKPTTIVFSVD